MNQNIIGELFNQRREQEATLPPDSGHHNAINYENQPLDLS